MKPDFGVKKRLRHYEQPKGFCLYLIKKAKIIWEGMKEKMI